MFKKYTKSSLERELSETDLTSSFPTRPYTSTLQMPSLGEVNLSSKPQDLIDPSFFDEPETTIGENVTIKGTLSFEKLVRIDGNFEGELQTQGKLYVGPKGVVKAAIDLEEAFISGKVEGNITVKTRLVLRGRAEIRGNITAPCMSVDEGVLIEGHVSVGKIENTTTSY